MENQLPTSKELNTTWRSIDPDLPDFTFEWSAKRTRSAATIYFQEHLIRLSVKHYLEFGMDIIVDSLKHEAAHFLAWLKHDERGHGQWLWYYLGQLGATRHCSSLSADMKAKRIRVKHSTPKKRVEYDPVSKTFKQFYE